MFANAIVRIPGENFSEGLTTATLGPPDYKRALDEHQRYCDVLEQCGLKLTILEPDLEHPDSTFVEDAAVLTKRTAILTNPGAASRKGEVTAIRPAIEKHFRNVVQIEAPGTLDGGDVCQAGSHYFIGISERTNQAGAEQLAGFLSQEGFTSSFVNIKGIPDLLHLKSGLAYLGDNNMVITEALSAMQEFQRYHLIKIAREENYAANCIRINRHVLVAEGFPRLYRALERLCYDVVPLAMSEFEKMDGGLSCLSLRF